MGAWYYLHCDTCQVTSHGSMSNGDDSIRALLANLSKFKQLREDRRFITVDLARFDDGIVEFALNHYGHSFSLEGDESREPVPDDAERGSIFEAILLERERQDEEWGGPAHDDQHSGRRWIDLIGKQSYEAENRLRYPSGDAPEGIENDLSYYEQRLVNIAALAVAALESLQRKRKG